MGQSCKKIDEGFALGRNRRIEGPFWKIVKERPQHFLDPRFETGDECLLANVDSVIKSATEKDAKLSDFTWGKLNTTKIQHPLSMAVPALSSWLDMPQEQLDGGWSDMPRIQAPASGASQRMAVSPGREEDGYMQFPVGNRDIAFTVLQQFAQRLGEWNSHAILAWAHKAQTDLGAPKLKKPENLWLVEVRLLKSSYLAAYSSTSK